MSATAPPITLYTNRACPFAHRAHIALSELQLPFDEQTIDLQKPRTAEYLQINPRGLVPSLKYGDEIITESSTVATFLADAYPSHLIPAPNSPKDALARARIGFFVDTYSSKLNPLFFKQTWSPDGAERDALAKEFIDIVVKELEPLLSNAAPFFGGSERLTLAEVLTGPFVIRALTLPKHGVLSANFLSDLESRAPNFFKWGQAVASHPSVLGIYDENAIAERSKEKRAEKLAEKAKA